ncbi:MAG: GNAT family N-acetyltransferase [Planctomycetota bacterium]|nr:GNAT family N-acetyltransferase [Planctomycetota bacterium]
MKATTYTSGSKFLEVAGNWLERQEVVNNLMLGLATRLANAEKPAEPPPVMMTVSGSQGLEGAALMTPPRGVVLYAHTDDTQEALDGLAEALLAGGYPVPECVGPSVSAGLFAKIWSDRTGRAAVKKTAQRIYELRQVRFPCGVPGSARPPRTEDLDLLARWTHEFILAVGEPGDAQASRTSAERAIAGGQSLLWEHEGQPVSMAAAVRPTRHGIAIGQVYTPPEHRGYGFASACVAELSQRQLNADRQFCCLYTDLANPTSNSIYQKIGYADVADSSHYRFYTAGKQADRCGNPA